MDEKKKEIECLVIVLRRKVEADEIRLKAAEEAARKAEEERRAEEKRLAEKNRNCKNPVAHKVCVSIATEN